VIRRKLIRSEVKVLDAASGRVEAVVSTESTDRQGDIIRQDGWDMKSFMLHPVLLASHDYYDLRSQIGEWEEMAVKGRKLVGVARYYVGEGNEQADWGFKLASKGRAAFSVGFIPDMDKAKRIEGDESDGDFWGHYEFNGQELLEVSHVTIPANADALQVIRAAKGLHPANADALQVIRSAKGLHPAIAEIVDEALKDLKIPASITLANSFDSQTEALLDAIAERISATLGKNGLASPPLGSPAPAVRARPDAGDSSNTPNRVVGEAIDLAKEFLLP